jgi:hypothetical protein
MKVDLGKTINRIAQDVTVSRKGQGTYVKGRFSEAAATTFVIQASVQTISGRERMLLPEGIRTREVLKLYTATPIQTASVQGATMADTITYNGSVYEAVISENWLADGNYFKVIFMRTGQ